MEHWPVQHCRHPLPERFAGARHDTMRSDTYTFLRRYDVFQHTWPAGNKPSRRRRKRRRLWPDLGPLLCDSWSSSCNPKFETLHSLQTRLRADRLAYTLLQAQLPSASRIDPRNSKYWGSLASMAQSRMDLRRQQRAIPHNYHSWTQKKMGDAFLAQALPQKTTPLPRSPPITNSRRLGGLQKT